MWYASNSEISNTHTTFDIAKKQTHYKIATNQSLNLSPRVSTRGLFFALVPKGDLRLKLLTTNEPLY